MIASFTDRHPALSALIVVALFTVVPAAFMFPVNALSGGAVNVAVIVFAYALILQLILWLKVERPVLIMLPFLMALGGSIVSEIVYTVSEAANPPGIGPSRWAFNFSSVVVIVFGTEAAASIGALLVYALIVIARKLREVFRA